MLATDQHGRPITPTAAVARTGADPDVGSSAWPGLRVRDVLCALAELDPKASVSVYSEAHGWPRRIGPLDVGDRPVLTHGATVGELTRRLAHHRRDAVVQLADGRQPRLVRVASGNELVAEGSNDFLAGPEVYLVADEGPA